MLTFLRKHCFLHSVAYANIEIAYDYHCNYSFFSLKVGSGGVVRVGVGRGTLDGFTECGISALLS